MNKLFTKIASLALGAAMAVGVGVVANSKAKDVKPVEAANGSYTLTFDSSTSSSASGGGTVCTSDWSTALTTAQFNTSGSTSSTISKVKYYYHCYGYGNIASVQTCTNIYPGKNSSLKVGKAAGDGVLAFTISGTDITISSVVINAYATANTVKLKVSEANASTKEQTVDVTTEGTAKNFTFTYPTSSTAVKTVSITGGQGKTSSNKIPYIKSITINYSDVVTTTHTVSFNVNTAGYGTVSQNSISNVPDGSSITTNGNQITIGSTTVTATPTTSTSEYEYSFTGWTNNTGTVTADRTITANFSRAAAPSYTSVTVTGGSLQGTEKGSAYIQCSASATGTNIPEYPSFTWYVTETNTYGTTTSVANKASIDNTGKVTFEDNCTVYVWALAPDGSTHNTSGYAATASGLVAQKGTQYNPYNVAEARYALDNSGTTSGVYVKGIVSAIKDAYSSTYHNVSYDLSDDGTLTASQLRAYRLSAQTDPGVKVGDVIVVTGDLTIYQSTTYEFSAGCTLYSHAQIQSLSVTTSPETNYDVGDNFDPTGLVVSATYNNGESNHSFSYANHQDNFEFSPSTTDILTSSDEEVTITYGNGSVNLSINVTVAPAVTDITLNPTSKVAYFEDEFNIAATVTTEGGASAAITWSIEDSSTLISIKNGTATNVGVTIVCGSTVGTAYVRATSNFNNQVYARCKVDVKDPDALVDEITPSLLGITGTNYTPWNNISDSTSAKYKGQSAGNYSTIQLNAASGYMMNSASAGYVRTFEITYDSHTSSNRTVTIYGSTTPFDTKADISNGTLLGSVTYDGTNESYTINVNSLYEFEYFGLVVNNALYLNGVTITYEKIDTSPSIQIIGDTSLVGEVNTSDSTSSSVKVKNIDSPVFSFTFDEDQQTGKVSSSYVSVSEGSPTDGIYPLTINFDNVGSTTINIDVSGQTASIDVTVIEVSYLSATLTEQYRLVTDASELQSGDEIIIADNNTDDTKDTFMNSTLTSGYFGVTEGTFTNNYIANSNVSDALILTLGGSAGAWTLQDSSDNYITANSSKNFVRGSTSGTWTISITNGNATITYEDSTYGYILHNVNSTRYKPYTSDPNVSMRLPQIYKHMSGAKNVRVESDLLSAISSAKSAFTCNSQGTSFDGTSFNSMSQYFTDVIKSKYYLDFAQSNESGNTAEQWLAMYDYAVGKYGADYDFLGRIASGKIVRSQTGTRLSLLTNNSGTEVAIIVVTSMIGLSAVGGYFFLRKRKENI